MCSYYEKRPSICRDYSAVNCERNGDGDSFKIMWKNVEEFEKWVEEGRVIPED
jgi:Fe-S-cluster containining protein